MIAKMGMSLKKRLTTLLVPHNLTKILFFWLSQPILIAKFALTVVKITLRPVIFVIISRKLSKVVKIKWLTK